MAREQVKIQAPYLSDIYKEACKVIISSCRMIFSQIPLTLFLPIYITILAHSKVSDVLFDKIFNNELALEKSVDGTPTYKKISHVVTSECSMLLLNKAIYFTFLLILFLLSTAAVVYTIACVHTARIISFKKVIGVVPKVWKRLMVNFLGIFLAMRVYNMIIYVALVLWSNFIGETKIGYLILVIIIIPYLIEFIYMSILWHLVASVLEDVFGVQAMVKCKNLIIGEEMSNAIFIVYQLNSSLIIMQVVFENLVVNGGSICMVGRLGFGILCHLLHLVMILFGLEIRLTVLYFVCKGNGAVGLP